MVSDHPSLPTSDSVESHELRRVWNKWTRHPVPQASQDACLDATDLVYSVVARLSTARGRDERAVIWPAGNLGAALGQSLGFLTRASYMLGLEHSSARHAHPFTAASIEAQVAYAFPLIQEAAKPAMRLLAGLVAEALQQGLVPAQSASHYAEEIGALLSSAAAASYEQGSADAPRHPSESEQLEIPSSKSLRQSWDGFEIPESIDNEFFELTTRVESASIELIDALSFELPFDTGPVVAMELRRRAASLTRDALSTALYLGLHINSLADDRLKQLSAPLLARLIVSAYPLLDFIARLPTMPQRTAYTLRQEDARLASTIIKLAIAGACRAYSIGLSIPLDHAR